jgi:hypothetical protein
MAINLQTAGGVAVTATPAQLKQIRDGIGISLDSFLLNRVNHTGQQTSSTISNFAAAVSIVVNSNVAVVANANGLIATNLAVAANTLKVSNATHTGDVTGATALTLATVNSNVGTFNSVTVNEKGLVIAGTTVIPPALTVFTAIADGLTPMSGGGSSNFLRADGAWTAPPTGPSGTVTSVSVTGANGVTGSVTTNTSTPAITLTLGAITPTSVAATGAVTGSNLSGTNTGDQTLTGLLPAQASAASKFLTSDGTTASWADVSGAEGGTVTSVSVTGANGVTGSVTTNTSTPAITLTLGAITPTSVAATGAVTGSNLSGTNTGDNSTNNQYANDYRVANFVAGTDYLVPNGSAELLTNFPTFNQDTTGSSSSITSNLPVTRLNGAAGATALTFWRGDGTWVNPIASTEPPAVITESAVLTVVAHANRKHIPVSSGTDINIDMPASATNGDAFVIINLGVGLITLRSNTGGTIIGASSLPATLAQYTVGEVWFANGSFVRIS